MKNLAKMVVSGDFIKRMVYGVLSALGVSFLSTAVLGTIFAGLVDTFKDQMMGLPNATLQLLGLMDADLALNIIVAAYAFKLAAGSFKVGKKS